jgi:hypothetical protein
MLVDARRCTACHGFIPYISKTIVIAFFLPFGGVSNILVCTGTKVSILRIRHPEYMYWVRAFLLVFKAGGEMLMEESSKKKISTISTTLFVAADSSESRQPKFRNSATMIPAHGDPAHGDPLSSIVVNPLLSRDPEDNVRHIAKLLELDIHWISTNRVIS